MNELQLVSCRGYNTPELQPNPGQRREHLRHWADWLRSLAAQNKLAHPVQHLDGKGKVITGQHVTSGPFTARRNSVGNLVLLRARDYQEAVELAQGGPALALGDTVEVRQTQ